MDPIVDAEHGQATACSEKENVESANGNHDSDFSQPSQMSATENLQSQKRSRSKRSRQQGSGAAAVEGSQEMGQPTERTARPRRTTQRRYYEPEQSYREDNTSGFPASVGRHIFPSAEEWAVMSRAERKRHREKVRRSDFKDAFDSLISILLKVDVDFRSETQDRERQKNQRLDQLAEGENTLFNRVELIHYAIVSIEKLYSQVLQQQETMMQAGVIFDNSVASVATAKGSIQPIVPIMSNEKDTKMPARSGRQRLMGNDTGERQVGQLPGTASLARPAHLPQIYQPHIGSFRVADIPVSGTARMGVALPSTAHQQAFQSQQRYTSDPVSQQQMILPRQDRHTSQAALPPQSSLLKGRYGMLNGVMLSGLQHQHLVANPLSLVGTGTSANTLANLPIVTDPALNTMALLQTQLAGGLLPALPLNPVALSAASAGSTLGAIPETVVSSICDRSSLRGYRGSYPDTTEGTRSDK